MKLSIIIPAYNEAPTIHLILDKVREVTLSQGLEKEVIVINDCSTDQTEQAIMAYQQAHPAFPVTIYYAFKQAESDGGEGTTNTGWDTFLAAVIKAGFAITGTWPMRTERSGRTIELGTNALASSIVLVCRKRPDDAPTIDRTTFGIDKYAQATGNDVRLSITAEALAKPAE